MQSKEKERKIVMINQRKGKEEKKKEKKEEIGNTLKNNWWQNKQTKERKKKRKEVGWEIKIKGFCRLKEAIQFTKEWKMIFYFTNKKEVSKKTKK